MKLQELFDYELFEKMVDLGQVTIRHHDTLPIAIACYSKLTPVTGMWNEVTTKCRGLVYDVNTNEVIARGFDKFYNHNQTEAAQLDPTVPLKVQSKVDGSLILTFRYKNHVVFSTKGSFNSTQAAAAEQLWKNASGVPRPVNGKTILSEFVGPSNRIVIDYPEHELILLDVLDVETGQSAGTVDRWPWRRVSDTEFEAKNLADVLNMPEIDDEEGYVIIQNNNRVKLKWSRYLTLHKLISNLSVKSVWEQLSAGRTAKDIAADIPDEWHGFVYNTAAGMYRKIVHIRREANEEFNDIYSQAVDRKHFAMLASQSTHRAYLFRLFDGKEIDSIIWKSIRPVGE